VGCCFSLSSWAKDCSEVHVRSESDILFTIRTRAFAASKASLTTDEFTVSGAVLPEFSSSRVARVVRLLSEISWSVIISSEVLAAS
jgi:hypothetical protein